MTLPVWRTEWLTALRRRRLLVLNTLIPLVFVAPIALSAAPAVHSAAAFTVLFALFGTFGSSIPLIRDGESGLLRRYVLTGVHPGGLLLQRVFANAALDLTELAPSVLVIFVARGSSVPQVAMVVPAMVPASPAPFTPKGLCVQGVFSWLETSKFGRSLARGIA